MIKNPICNQELYVILDTGYVSNAQLPYITEKVIAGGCKLIQFRDKKSSQEDIIKLGKQIKKIIPHDVIFILNDFVHLVKEVEADGVHLGQEDMPILQAREILGPQAVIGLSTHSYDQAMASRKEPVDYIGFGPVFKTKTKPQANPIGIQNISQITKDLSHMIFPIGGISESNIQEIISAGAKGVCMVSAILESQDIQNTVKNMINLIKECKEQCHEKTLSR